MMVIHEPGIRLGQGKYCSTTVVPGFATLRQCPRVVCSQGQAPSKSQMGLDLGVCDHCIADSFPAHTNALTSVSGIQCYLTGKQHCSGSPDQDRQSHIEFSSSVD